MRKLCSLSPTQEQEKTLQALLDAWPPRDWSLAGTPEWLLPLGEGQRNDRRKVKTRVGKSFTPDVRWPNALIEIKSAEKYEPLGLAQVLYEAWMLGRPEYLLEAESAVSAVPILMTRYNQWNRAALSYLFENGLKQGALRYCEFTVLRDPQNQFQLLWFDEPLAPWETIGSPPFDLGDVAKDCVWHKVNDAEVWVGLARATPKRPAFLAESSLWVARTSTANCWATWAGTEDGAEGEYSLFEVMPVQTFM